jgi:protein ATS1
MSILLSSGSNAHGQLSNGSQDDSHEFHPCSFYGCPPGELPPQTRRVKHIASGANHTLVLLETYNQSGEVLGELWGCGDGRSGQLGTAYQAKNQAAKSSAIFYPIDLPLEQAGLEYYRIKSLAAAWETTYIVLSCVDDGDVVISMGSNDFGDLGIGGSKKGKERQETPSFYVINFDHLTIDGMSVDTKSIIVQSLDAGQHHAVVHLQATLNHGGTRRFTVGWGTSRHGQLGNLTQSGKTPAFVSIPQIVSNDEPKDPMVSTSLGNQHTVFLRASGKVAALGSNRKGQLQGIEDLEGVRKLGCTWNGTYVLAQGEDGNMHVLATGSHSHGQLGRTLHDSSQLPSLAPVDFPFSLHSRCVVDMACGSEHVLALVSPDNKPTEVWGWGWNEHGNLGTGLTENVLIPVKVWPRDSSTGAPSQNAIGIWAGSGTSWIYVTT